MKRRQLVHDLESGDLAFPGVVSASLVPLRVRLIVLILALVLVLVVLLSFH